MAAPLGPFEPASYGPAQVGAFKALAEGNATPHQQKIALDWLIWKAALTYDETFVPGRPDVSDYLQGRRNVGLQVVKLVNMPADDFDKLKREVRDDG